MQGAVSLLQPQLKIRALRSSLTLIHPSSASPAALGGVSNHHWSIARGSSCPPWISKGSHDQDQIPSAVTDKTRQLETLYLPLIPYIYSKFFINQTLDLLLPLCSKEMFQVVFSFSTQNQTFFVRNSPSQTLFLFFLYLYLCVCETNLHSFPQFHQLTWSAVLDLKQSAVTQHWDFLIFEKLLKHCFSINIYCVYWWLKK